MNASSYTIITAHKNKQNPWERISLNDYENHMSLDSVNQLQTLNSIMKRQFETYPVESVIILGIAGGNGLFIIANLLIEYTGYSAFRKVVRQIEPEYVSCVIQINTDEDNWVSDSPYIHSFDCLDDIHHQMEEKDIAKTMNEEGYHLILRESWDLPNGKALVRLDFEYRESKGMGGNAVISYQRLTENELDTFIQMRIHQLREEGAKENIDLVPALQDYYKRHMADGTFVSWMAMDGEKIVGTSGMSFVEKPPYFGCPSGKMGLLSSMFTDPEYRRRGIAKELLSRVVDEAKAYGCGTVQITASDMGVLLYTDFGFVKNGNFMQYKL